LLLNACEAVSSSTGKVNVEIYQNRDRIEVRISDNGRGVPEDLTDKIFEPFFTQGKANGTGLGLTVAHKIVQDHGGDLFLESTSATGTVFRVILPIRAAEQSDILGDADKLSTAQPG